MKFEFLLIASILSSLSNSANINNNNKQQLSNTPVPSHKNAIKPISCFADEYLFNDLNGNNVTKTIKEIVKKSPVKVIKFKFFNNSKEADNTYCGLLITKNNTLNTYNFKYDFFNKSDCTSKSDVICNNTYCGETAIKCCKPTVCNLYSVFPTDNKKCTEHKDARCFNIDDISNEANTLKFSLMLAFMTNFMLIFSY